jgi:cysteinyl-tRNA synthetase, unknown class
MRIAPIVLLSLALSACDALQLNSTTATQASSIFASPSALSSGGTTAPQLSAAKYFAIQLQNVGQNGPIDVPFIALISASRYDVVTIDEITTYNGAAKLAQGQIVNQIHATPGATLSRKIALAYIDIGEAESYRTYFQSSWAIGSPTFLLAGDPNGFSNNFIVSYSDPRWQSIVFGSPGSLVDQALADGFDGVFLDNVTAYSYPAVVAVDRSAQSDMVTFVAAISTYAKSRNPNFLIVTNNGSGLTTDSRLIAAIDGDSEESLFYGNSASQQGDIQTDSGTRAATLTLVQRIQAVNKPVFSVDYATKSDDVQLAYAGAAANRLIEYVTTRSLSQLTTTPPSGLSPQSTRRSVDAH